MNFDGSNAEDYRLAAPNGYKIRGYFINEFIVIERLMDRFVARHFSSDLNKQMELIELYLSTKRIGFESKRQAFKFLAKKYYREKFPNYEQTSSNLKKLEDLRNILAHNILDTTKDGINSMANGDIRFVKFENESFQITYTAKEIEYFRSLIKELQSEFFNALN